MDEDEQLVNELAPNNSEAIPGVYVPEANREVEVEAQAEEAVLASAIPLMQQLLDWFSEQIALTDSVNQVHRTAKAYDGDTANALIAHDIVRHLLEGKKADLQGAYDRFMNSEEP